MSVLLIGCQDDVHCDALQRALRSRTEVHRIHVGSPDSFYLDLVGTPALRARGKCINVDGVQGVFCFNARVQVSSTEGDEIDRALVDGQWRNLVETLGVIFPQRAWINHPFVARQSTNAAIQLATAQKIGLSVPRTCLCTTANEALTFVQDVSRAVLKFASPANLRLPGGLVLRKPVLDVRSSIWLKPWKGPILLQAFVDAAAQVRCYVIDGQVFSCEMSARDLKQQPGYLAEPLVPVAPYPLSSDLQAQLISLVAELNLQYSAIDLCVTKSGQPIFIEANAGGYSLATERACGLPITLAIARALCARQPTSEPTLQGVNIARDSSPKTTLILLENSPLPDLFSSLITLKHWDKSWHHLHNAFSVNGEFGWLHNLLSSIAEWCPNVKAFSASTETSERARDVLRVWAGAGAHISSLQNILDTQTIIIRNVHEHDHAVERLRAALQEYFGCKVRANLYASTQTSVAFPTHVDDHHIVAIQLTGSKTWQISSPIEYHPQSRPLDEASDRYTGVEYRKVTLTKGECLYIPWGAPHAAKCTSDASLSMHLTFGIFPPTVASEAAKALQAEVQHSSHLRASLQFNFEPSDGFRYERSV